MAAKDSQYRVQLTFKGEEMGKDEPPMFISETVWTGLDYPALVAFEAEILDAIVGALKKLGLAGIATMDDKKK